MNRRAECGAPVKGRGDRNATNGRLRGLGSSSGGACAEESLEMRPLEQSVGMSLDITKDQSPLMGPSTFDL